MDVQEIHIYVGYTIKRENSDVVLIVQFLLTDSRSLLSPTAKYNKDKSPKKKKKKEQDADAGRGRGGGAVRGGFRGRGRGRGRMMPAGSKRKGDVSDSSSSEDDDEDDGAAVTRQVGYFVL